jgi:YD repeat-containing protein
VTDASGQTTYAYDNVGNLQSFAYPNGVTTAYTYDTLNRLTQMGAGKNGTQQANYVYTLGAAGNRLTVAELSGLTVNYGYAGKSGIRVYPGSPNGENLGCSKGRTPQTVLN